ncbi:hypothetical protein M426DRAFT_200684 [Hypoxylon sp. CI-4A]|nr:hypothetical protein M426DRAFT_200684 [Hypoxylon sp. CI-4A]
MDGAIDPIDNPMTQAFLNHHECCVASAPAREECRTPSPPSTPQKDSPSFESDQETPVIGTISAYPATVEKKPPTRVSTPTTPKLHRILQQNAEANGVNTPKDTGASEKPEKAKAKAQTPERMDLRGTSIREGRLARRSDSGRRSASVSRTPSIVLPEGHRRQSAEEPRDGMVEEAARIAVLRSRAKEIVRGKSVDRRTTTATPAPTGRNGSRAPSPGKRHAGQDSKANETPEPKLQKRPKKKKRLGDEGAAGTGLPSSKPESSSSSSSSSSGRSTSATQTPTLTQASHNKRGASATSSGTNATTEEEKEATDRLDGSASRITLVQFCKTIYIVFLGLACTWWIVVRPAFDQRSDLWRRRYRKQSTWKDVAVFLAAGVFCLAGVLGVWYVSRVTWCLMR